MTRKDYLLLANSLYWSKPDTTPDIPQWRSDVEAISTALQRDNPHFKRDVFLKACGVEVCTSINRF
jgi:hypothetical protein